MTTISRIARENSGAEVIDDIDGYSIYSWLNEKHKEAGIGHSNLPAVTDKYDSEYKKCRLELVLDEPKYQPFRRFIHNDLSEKIVKALRADKIDAFRRRLGFNVIDAFNAKQWSVTKTIKKVSEGEDIQTEYSVLRFRVDLYFHEYKLAIKLMNLIIAIEILTMK